MTKRERVYNKYGGLCAYTGKPLGPDWQIDHVVPVRAFRRYENFKFVGYDGKPHDISNLLPAIRIINHYKRGQDLELFRRYISELHVRMSKLPKNTQVPQTIARKAYIAEVANLFEIAPDKPFGGLFYFETLTDEIRRIL